MHSTENVNERRVKDFVLKRFEHHFQLPAGNSDYPEGAYLAVLILTAMAHRFVDGFAETIRRTWLLPVPSGDTIRRLNRMPARDVKRQLLEINNDVLSKAVRMRMFTHPVTCAIDCNDREYYGKRTSKLVVGGKHKNGTSWFYRIATLCVVENGMRFEIAATEYRRLYVSIYTILTYSLHDSFFPLASVSLSSLRRSMTSASSATSFLSLAFSCFSAMTSLLGPATASFIP